jgi:hypothetical protein
MVCARRAPSFHRVRPRPWPYVVRLIAPDPTVHCPDASRSRRCQPSRGRSAKRAGIWSTDDRRPCLCWYRLKSDPLWQVKIGLRRSRGLHPECVAPRLIYQAPDPKRSARTGRRPECLPPRSRLPRPSRSPFRRRSGTAGRSGRCGLLAGRKDHLGHLYHR